MEDRLDSSGQRLAGLLKAGDFDSARALLRSNLKGRARSLQDDVLLVLFKSPPPETALGSVAEALLRLAPDASGFSTLAEHLEANGAALAAQVAQRCAAELDFDAHPAMDVWGGAFNGQERRQTLFDQRELFDENRLPPGPALFYLDAHWEHDLPLWEEIDEIFSRHPSPVVMVDDFRVPTDSGFAYDNYGKGKCLSVTNLHEAVTTRPSMFFPKHASAHETGARRGCVVLAQGDLADYTRRKVPMLTELSLSDALVLDGVGELRNDLARVALAVAKTASREQELQRCLTDELQQIRARSEAQQADLAGELQQTRARSEAQQADLLAKIARLELRAHELSSAVARAEFIQQQRELEAENAKRDAATAREAVTGLQNLVLRLHEELRSGRTETQETLRQVAELQHSRWRRIGLLLGLARKASFER